MMRTLENHPICFPVNPSSIGSHPHIPQSCCVIVSSPVSTRLKALDPHVKKYIPNPEKKNINVELKVAALKLKQKVLYKRIKSLEKKSPANSLTPDEIKRFHYPIP